MSHDKSNRIMRVKRLIIITILCISNIQNIASYRISTTILPLHSKENSYAHATRFHTRSIGNARTRKQRISPPNQLKKKSHKSKKSITYNTRPKKKWTFLIYIAADNDLNFYAWKNIKQMEKIGSGENLNIVIQVAERGRYKPTQRYIVEKNHLQKINFGNKKLNSGSINTLINFCGWGIETCPAEHYALILWNHGTGAKEPSTIKSLNTSELFVLNPATNMLELDRSISFFEFISVDHKSEQNCKGICIDETHRSYISNTQLDHGLKKICNTHLKGKPFDIIGFDACFMSMLEIASIVKQYAHIMIGSQEVELGAGWNYQHVLKLFSEYSPTPAELADHIVQSYKQITSQITQDFTLSAINLNIVVTLEDNINIIADLLIESLEKQKENSIRDIIKMCRSRRLCETFDEPSYIDLHNLYANLLKNLHYFQFDKASEDLLTKLKHHLNKGLSLINEIVIANCVGNNLSRAKGISIYFPESNPHKSYNSLPFSQNQWPKFLKKYALLR